MTPGVSQETTWTGVRSYFGSILVIVEKEKAWRCFLKDTWIQSYLCLFKNIINSLCSIAIFNYLSFIKLLLLKMDCWTTWLKGCHRLALLMILEFMGHWVLHCHAQAMQFIIKINSCWVFFHTVWNFLKSPSANKERNHLNLAGALGTASDLYNGSCPWKGVWKGCSEGAVRQRQGPWGNQ